MFEVYNEIVKDLMTMPVGGSGYVDLKETATKGVHVRVSEYIIASEYQIFISI